MVLEEDTQEVCPWFQRICQGCEGCKNQQGCSWDGKHFNLDVGDDGTEALLRVVPKELTNGELLELEQEYITEEEVR